MCLALKGMGDAPPPTVLLSCNDHRDFQSHFSGISMVEFLIMTDSSGG